MSGLVKQWPAMRPVLAAAAALSVMMLWLVQSSSLLAAGSATARVKTTIDEVIRILSDEEMKKPARHQERRKLLETP